MKPHGYQLSGERLEMNRHNRANCAQTHDCRLVCYHHDHGIEYIIYGARCSSEFVKFESDSPDGLNIEKNTC
jgi:hypothetical protein